MLCSQIVIFITFKLSNDICYIRQIESYKENKDITNQMYYTKWTKMKPYYFSNIITKKVFSINVIDLKIMSIHWVQSCGQIMAGVPLKFIKISN